MFKKDKEKIEKIKQELIPIDVIHQAEKLGLTTKDLVKKSNVSETIICNAYNGKAPMCLGRIHELCKKRTKVSH